MSIQYLELVALIWVATFKFELKEPLDLPDNTYCLLCR